MHPLSMYMRIFEVKESLVEPLIRLKPDQLRLFKLIRMKWLVLFLPFPDKASIQDCKDRLHLIRMMLSIETWDRTGTIFHDT